MSNPRKILECKEAVVAARVAVEAARRTLHDCSDSEVFKADARLVAAEDELHDAFLEYYVASELEAGRDPHAVGEQRGAA